MYNTFPLNDCPADLWDHLDGEALAAANGAVAALLNGPRYWLMSSIAKDPDVPQPIRRFGGIEMIEQDSLQT